MKITDKKNATNKQACFFFINQYLPLKTVYAVKIENKETDYTFV